VNPLAKVVSRKAVPPPADPAPVAAAHATVGSSDPIRPVPVKTVAYHTVTVRSASMQPMPVLVPVVGDDGHAAPQPAQPIAQPVQHNAEPTPHAPEPQGEEVEAQAAPVEPAHTIVAMREPIPAAPAKPERALAETAKSAPAKQAALPAAPPPHAHGGWVIQIGAYEAEQEARQHLSDARSKVHAALAAADPFTERVQKGDKALYRARFAGFDKTTAEAACRQLKHSDFACLALKD
jgi:D-alanyl-D-alanine carboxypeptidase